MEKYQFKHSDMVFSKDGSLDELIALDRYVVTEHGNYNVGDTVVAIVDKKKKTKNVGEITKNNGDGTFEVLNRLGVIHTVEESLMQRPMELEPHQLWSRWAKGGASVEKTAELREWFENELRWLFDGYRYSLGGRIQLMLGQEYVRGERANLTAYNCYVIRSPYALEDAKQQFLDVVKVAFYEASIMRRGGGVGLNLSTINTVAGSGAKREDFIFFLDKQHPDHDELLDLTLLSRLNGVKLVTDRDEFSKILGDSSVEFIRATDSVDGLFDNMEDLVEYSYDGKKVAIDFSGLRHRDAIVKGVNGRSSGSVSWMEVFVRIANLLQQDEIDCVDFAEIYSDITNLIEQGGSRRGALMLILNIANAKVRKFMERKKQAGFLSGANISVGVDDEFMHLVMSGKEAKKNSRLPSSDQDDAMKLWDTLIQSAWSSAEPGIVWLERYNKESNSWYFHEIVATNPCGEQGLPPFGVCNLGHYVLPAYFNKETGDVDWEMLDRAIKIAVRLQDNVIDYTSYFLDENRDVQLSERRVGIGTLGLGTLMIQMGLRYGSDEGNVFIEKLYGFIAKHTYAASIELAGEKGAFPKFEYKKFIQSGFMKRLLGEFPELNETLKLYGIRNVTTLTQAPTGSTGTYIDNIPLFRELFGGTTTGIEPYYSWTYWRAGRLGMSEQSVHIADEYMREHDLESFEELPQEFVTAMELSPIEHVKVQAAVQKYTDSSISKTANAPSDFTAEQTDELYIEAYKMGLKGVTIYRDKSRDAQVLATNKEDAKLETHIEADKLERLRGKESAAAWKELFDRVDAAHEAESEAEKFDREKMIDEMNSIDNDSFSLFGDAAKNIGTTTSGSGKQIAENIKRVGELLDKNKVKFYEGGIDFANSDVTGYSPVFKEPSIKKVPSRLFGMREKVRYQSGDQMSKAYIHIYTDETGTPVEVWIEPTDVRDKDMADALGRMTTQFLRFGATTNNVEQAIKHLKTGKMMMSLPAIIGRLLSDIYYGKIEMPSFPKKNEIGDLTKQVITKKTFEMAKCEQCGENAYDKANCLCHACGQSKCN